MSYKILNIGKAALLGIILSISISTANAQLLNKVKKLAEEQTKSASSYTESEAGKAIKEALNKGVEEGVALISQEDGYFKNPKIKIPFPEEAETIEKKLRSMGMGDKIDEVVLSLNRAAEDAASEATDIFIAAIKEMTLKDAIDIVKGNDDAATQYLENHTSDELTEKFKPVIKTSLDKVDATKYWKDVMTIYNKIPFVEKVNTDLAQYATEKAIEGVFVKIAEEEKDIRDNPSARTTELLKKVFK